MKISTNVEKMFSGIPEVLPFEGPKTKNPWAYRYFQPKRVVRGRTMSDWIKPALAWWHTINNRLSDMFGPDAHTLPWMPSPDSLDSAFLNIEVAARIMRCTGLSHFCIHTMDIAPEGATLSQTKKQVFDVLRRMKSDFGDDFKFLWTTPNLFSDPRFRQGAGDGPSAKVAALATTHGMWALEAAKEVDAQQFNSWMGRSRAGHILNSHHDDFDRLGLYFQRMAEYAKKIGFTGRKLIEPKPFEPQESAVFRDGPTTAFWLSEWNLRREYGLNLEIDHEKLAGHDPWRSFWTARKMDMLWGFDWNAGSQTCGYDWDKAGQDRKLACGVMLEVVQTPNYDGGANHDAKVDFASNSVADRVKLIQVATDALAFGLLFADTFLNDGEAAAFLDDLYADQNEEVGQLMNDPKTDLAEIEKWAMAHESEIVVPKSGQIEARLEHFQRICDQVVIDNAA